MARSTSKGGVSSTHCFPQVILCPLLDRQPRGDPHHRRSAPLTDTEPGGFSHESGLMLFRRPVSRWMARQIRSALRCGRPTEPDDDAAHSFTPDDARDIPLNVIIAINQSGHCTRPGNGRRRLIRSLQVRRQLSARPRSRERWSRPDSDALSHRMLDIRKRRAADFS